MTERNPFDKVREPRPFVVAEHLLGSDVTPVTMDELHAAVRAADPANTRGLASRMLAGVLRTLEDDGFRFVRDRASDGTVSYRRSSDLTDRVTKRDGDDGKRVYRPTPNVKASASEVEHVPLPPTPVRRLNTAVESVPVPSRKPAAGSSERVVARRRTVLRKKAQTTS
jgi:hypothetical protein